MRCMDARRPDSLGGRHSTQQRGSVAWVERPLGERERDLLLAMIERGVDSSSTMDVTSADRRRWMTQVARTRVVGHCTCGTCPSVDLAIIGGTAVHGGSERAPVVLEAFTSEALLLLFIEDDRLSYLELAPTDPDLPVAEFPPADIIEFPST